MPPKWPTLKLGRVLMQIFALTVSWTPFIYSENLYEIKFIPTDGSREALDTILMAPEECLPMKTFWLSNSSSMDTEGNCLELWSKKNCDGDVLYYVSSANDGINSVPWAKSVKLCEVGKQPSHLIVRRGLVENSTEYYFWFYFSKLRGRSVVFLEEYRKGGPGGHPDWETIMGGRNWQGPRSKLYLKALYKVINVFKTYTDMDMKWSRYSTEDLAKLKQLASDVVKLRELKTLKFPHTDPQSKVHAKIVEIWKNITITLDKAYETKSKYDQEVKLGRSKKQFSGTILSDVTLMSSSPVRSNERSESSVKISVVDTTATKTTCSEKPTTSKPEKELPSDESVIRIVD